MTTTITDFDQSLRDDVTRQLAWEPALDASMVGVTTVGGIATLSGYVDTHEAKLAAERAARRVYGVRAVANELDVRFAHERIDPDIARDALDALKRHINVPPGIGVTVREGDITLTGTVEWMFQKMAAERAVRYLKGVRDVFNDVVITPKVSPKDVQTHVLEALYRHADLDARLIRVTDAVIASSPAFRFARTFTGLEIVPRRGDVIAWDGDQAVRAPYDNCVLVMPVPNNVKTGLTAVRLGRVEAR